MTEKEEKPVISEAELASALNGNFLEKMKEFAWRGKDAKLGEIPNNEMHSFHLTVSFTFPAIAEDPEALSFEKLSAYRFQCSPYTLEDIRKAQENSSEE